MLKTCGCRSPSEYCIQVLLFIRDAILQDENTDIEGYLKKSCEVHNHNTRGVTKFHLPTQNNKSAQKSIFINGLKKFNELPSELRDVSRKVFKARVIQFVKESIPILPSISSTVLI